jgi:hypothetical protein
MAEPAAAAQKMLLILAVFLRYTLFQSRARFGAKATILFDLQKIFLRCDATGNTSASGSQDAL